ncbi:MAG: hypothetical protein LPD71_14250, partial [Shewanella sp.]|nr:hypothetical protein [Shewanella sp.]
MFDPKIVDRFSDYIQGTEINTAISQAEMLGWLLWKNDIGIYSLRQLECALTLKVAQQLSLQPGEDTRHETVACEVLFLATEMYLSGGHSRLAENLSSYIDNHADLLVTRGLSPEVAAREQNHFRQLFSITRHKRDRITEIRQIVQRLLGYRQIIVNIHPSDIVSTIACALAKQLQPELEIFYVNHADHVFNFGVSTADVWFEVSLYGHHLDSRRELTSQKSFLGIPVKVNDVDISKLNFQDGDLMMTAGAMFKYKPVDGYSLMPLLDALLKQYRSSRCQVIGVDPWHDWWWWPLKLKYPSRLILCGTLPYADYLAVTGKAKLYIDSQPLTGGTAFVEQFFQNR